jgi:hypothetical protein
MAPKKTLRGGRHLFYERAMLWLAILSGLTGYLGFAIGIGKVLAACNETGPESPALHEHLRYPARAQESDATLSFGADTWSSTSEA